MDHLTKSQVIFLSVFLSFVTALGASVVTTAVLTERAGVPSPTVQTINRVIERVIPMPTPAPVPAPTQKDQEKPAPSSEDLIVSAINRNLGSLADVIVKDDVGSAILRGVAVGDKILLAPKAAATGNELYVRYNGVSYLATTKVSTTTKDSPFVLVMVGDRVSLKGDVTATTTPVDTTPIHLSAVIFSGTAASKVGQAVIVLGGENGGTADYGIISAIVKIIKTEKDILERIKVSVPFSRNDAGKLVLSPAGDVVGIVAEEGDDILAVPAQEIKQFLAAAGR